MYRRKRDNRLPGFESLACLLLDKLVQLRVVSEEILAGTGIPGGGEEGDYIPNAALTDITRMTPRISDESR